ncbi:hypothetical protein AB6A40_003226 [Gnathostoma spinigerum]|uniref:Uncharacterized protein n=1 Tax=Gnathostoma spinigerum TaxID=75299 RepID=A0ABD6EIL6_9BILA
MTRFKNRKLKDRVLEGTPVTIEWIIKHLREGSIEWQQQYEKCTIKDIETKDVSEGKGFVSKIFRIHFEFCENDVQPYDVVAKIPISSKLTELLEDRSTESDNLKVCFNNHSLHDFHVHMWRKASERCK